MDPESIMLNEMSDKDNTVWLNLYVESKKPEFIETESRVMVIRVGGWGKWGDVGQRVPTYTYKMNMSWGYNIKHGDYS